MARPRSFDESEVLDRVTRTFWERGYANTSIADLEAASGLGRQSLYSAFGDKHALFLLALERYGAQADRQFSAPASDTPALAQLRDIMYAAVDFFTANDCPGPCLVVQAVLEFGDSNAEVSAKCQGNTGRVKEWIGQQLRAAADRGELAAGVDPAGATTALMSQYFAIPLMARNGSSAEQLKAGIRVLLDQFASKRPPASH